MRTPNAGSKEAGLKGCTCPVIDNHFGRGRPTKSGKPEFIFSADCPLHGFPKGADMSEIERLLPH